MNYSSNSQNIGLGEEEEDIGPLPFEDDIENDNIDGNEEEDFNLSPDHPLFNKLNDDIKTQLNKQVDDLDVQIRDKSALKNKLSADREQIGVELYAVQQQLAKIHQSLTEANTAREEAEAYRLEYEKQLKDEREELKQTQIELDQRTKEYERQRSELDKLNETVRLLEQRNQEIINQKSVVQRETYKSEQSAKETENAKLQQDLYIDRLTQQVQDITSQLSSIETQILAQRGETKTARDALLQASLEMEKINFERNHLLQDWNSALIGVKRRSTTLQEIEAASAKQEEEIRALENEVDGLKKQIADQQEQAERNTNMMNKIDSRINYLDGKINEASDERKTLQQKLSDLYETIKKKEVDISKLLIERNNAKTEFAQSQKGANEISNQIHELEDKIITHVTDQSNLKRDTIATQHMVEQIRDQISAKDRELSDLQNEVVRLRIDKLNISAQSEKLQRGLAEIVAELKTKDELISQYEMQIRRNNTDIEKRQSEVDKLNRQYDSLKSAQNGEEYGPLERKIRQIQSRIQQIDEAQQENQATWLKKQTELVSLAHQCEDMEKSNMTQQAHIAVLSRKRDRVRTQLRTTEKEIEKLQIQIRLHQREMSRLGEQLSNSVNEGNALVEGNVNYEAEILENLKKKEEEAAKSESQIEELASIRESLAEDLMETEKTIMMWEKKLQLAREMREALDPNYGASELNSMKKEVNRMELRLKQIKKQQQVIVQEMEYALVRRETIATKGQVQNRLNKDKTRADVTKGITELKREIKRLNEETAKSDASMRENVDIQRELGTEIEQYAHMERETKLNKSEIEKRLQSEEKAKVVAQSKLEKLQAKHRLFAAKNPKTILKSPDGFQQAYDNLKHQQSQLQKLIEMLTAEFPHLSDNFNFIKTRVLSE
ncbi:Coiled-coil domain-containing protein 40 [Tritrichomonas musculus]|uniref:Coiled-coil domain-containing protein 40 n=1 Tax=Tritrichomonas musculus TaxID=1915356 RepID=A0ABR2KH67_9EUKA